MMYVGVHISQRTWYHQVNHFFYFYKRSNEDYHSIREVFPNAVFSHIPQCGHWVHFEKPNEFLQHIKDYLHPRKIPLFHASL